MISSPHMLSMKREKQRERTVTLMKDTSLRQAAHPTVVVLGGDARQVAVIRELVRADCPVSVYAAGLCGGSLPDGVRLCGHRAACLRAIEETDDRRSPAPLWLLLPLPASRDGETVNCPLEPEAHIPLSEVAEAMLRLRHARLLGGCLPAGFCRELKDRLGADAYGARVTDYYTLESIQIPNARITAEAAIMTAMELTDTALLGARVAVLGYGRIGQLLSRLLLPLGVSVTVAARREEALAYARMDGCKTLRMESATSLHPLAQGYAVIFNTVPAPVIGQSLLELMDPETLILDLASAPGGIDPLVAARLAGADPASRLRIIRAPSLPGRYAPTTAGNVLADALLPLILEDGQREVAP